MEKRIQKKAQEFRLKCYRRMLLIDESEDYAIQDYQEDYRKAQKTVKPLFAYLDTHDLTPAEQAELLLTIFLGLQIGFRNSELTERATARALELLPQLTGRSSFAAYPRQGKLLCHLLVYLYNETEDETLFPAIDRLFSAFPRPLTPEDLYLQQVYQNILESIPYRPSAVQPALCC